VREAQNSSISVPYIDEKKANVPYLSATVLRYVSCILPSHPPPDYPPASRVHSFRRAILRSVVVHNIHQAAASVLRKNNSSTASIAKTKQSCSIFVIL
jgi:hypothetical protein